MPSTATEREPEQPKRRILCIDGGGIRGAFPAAFLAEMERELDGPIGSYFDLIAGTSTGGILAIGLSLGFSASELLDFYEKRGPEIFGEDHGGTIKAVYRKFRWWLYRPKYDSNVLRAALQEVLGNRRIGDARTRLVVPAWNPTSKAVYIYKTAHHPRLKTDYRSGAVDAALATSAAPTYFQQHITQHGVGLLDGGIWAHNPIAVAVVEAITLLGWDRESLHILSLGCLEEVYRIPKRAGIGTLNSKIIKLFVDGQSHGAMGMAKLLTGHEHDRTAIYRINQTVPYRAYKMDDTAAIQELKGLGHDEARDRRPTLKPIFFDRPAEVFTPIYQLDEEAQ